MSAIDEMLAARQKEKARRIAINMEFGRWYALLDFYSRSGRL